MMRRTSPWISFSLVLASGLAATLGLAFSAPTLEAQDAPSSGSTPRPTPSSGSVSGTAVPTEASPASAESESTAITIRAASATSPIQVDGQLDEALYATVPAITEFVQSLPSAGAAPTERTEAWVAFDAANVYVAARVWDSAPEGDWVANEMRRDSPSIESNDQFGVYFDTFLDRRNSLGFFVNPLGGFTDLQVTNEEAANVDWNPTTQVRTGRFEGGWTVEMAIPFRALRYRSGTDQTWGIQMRRLIVRKNEWIHLTPLPLSVVRMGQQGANRVSLYATLTGIQAPEPRRNLEVKPYAISGLRTDLLAEPELSNDTYADAGLDVKYGITQNLTADFTFNTDFAQVEVDEQQVNLTRFNVFFPEKREFFLEGQGIFEFGSGGRGEGAGGGGGPGLGSSGRGRGGRSNIAPTFFHSRQIGLQDGAPVPILGGGRLTGKVGAFDVGAVGIRTDDSGVDTEAANFGVLRLRRDVFARSSVGLLVEGRSNSVVAEEGGNLAYGLDANFALLDNIQIFGYYAKTDTEGLEGRDDSFRARVGYRGDIISSSIDHVMVGDDFNPELGFLRRSDFRETNLFTRFSPRPASIPQIRQVTFGANLDYIEGVRSKLLESRMRSGRIEVEFQSSDWITAVFTDNLERLDEDATISGATFQPGRYSFRDVELGYTFGPHRRISGNLALRWGGFYSGDVLSVGFTRGRVEVLPNLSLEPSVELNWIDMPDDEGGERIDQHVARTRLVYGLSQRMYVSGLVQYNTGSGNVSANFRFRWEWAPGSELFVVYTEDRDTDVFDRWSELSNRGLAIKVTRLFQL